MAAGAACTGGGALALSRPCPSSETGGGAAIIEMPRRGTGAGGIGKIAVETTVIAMFGSSALSA